MKPVTTTTKSDKPVRQIRPGTKLARVLSALAQGGDFNRFEAEGLLNDHCLHTTVSTIQGYGIQVTRKTERVPCVGGTAHTDVCRYWLTQTEREKALALLGKSNVEVAA